MCYGFGSFGDYDLTDELEKIEKRSIVKRYAKWRKKICSDEILNAFPLEPVWNKWSGNWTCKSTCNQYRLVFNIKTETATLYCR